MKEINKIPSLGEYLNSKEIYLMGLITSVVHQSSIALEDIVEKANQRLPDGLDLVLLPPNIEVDGVTGAQGKNLTVTVKIDEAILPQEFQEAITSTIERLSVFLPSNQTPQSRPNHHEGLFSWEGRSYG